MGCLLTDGEEYNAITRGIENKAIARNAVKDAERKKQVEAIKGRVIARSDRFRLLAQLRGER